jgi:hypothetical protein
MRNDDSFEDDLRLEFSMMDGPAPTTSFVEHTVRRYRRWRSRRRLLMATPGVATAAGLGLALGLSGAGSPGPAGTGGSASVDAHHPSDANAVRLENHVFHLPSGFRLTAATTTACHPDAVPATNNPPHITGTPKEVRVYPYTTTQLATAVNSTGGCVVFAVTGSFTPTSATPNPYLPFTVSTPGVRQVDVDGDVAWLQTNPSPSETRPAYSLTVELPQANGQIQDLAVVSIGVSASELLTVISQGLS